MRNERNMKEEGKEHETGNYFLSFFVPSSFFFSICPGVVFLSLVFVFSVPFVVFHIVPTECVVLPPRFPSFFQRSTLSRFLSQAVWSMLFLDDKDTLSFISEFISAVTSDVTYQ